MIPPVGEIDELTEWKRTHTHNTYGRTGKRADGIPRGGSHLSTLFHTFGIFTSAGVFPSGLGLRDFFLPLCINAPCSPCGFYIYFLFFLYFFFSFLYFYLYSLSLSIPPAMGGKRKKQCIRLSFFTFLLLSYTIFASFSNKRITMAFVTATLEEQEDEPHSGNARCRGPMWDV